MFLQNCRSAIRSLLCGHAHNHHRAPLFYMASIKFLLADVVRLCPGFIAHLAFLQRATRARQTRNPTLLRLARFRGRLTRRVSRARVLINLADHLHLPALDACLFQILHRSLRIRVTIHNSYDHKFHDLCPLNPRRKYFQRLRMLAIV